MPIIVLTAFADELSASKTFRYGAQDCLVKGQFDSRMLMRSIRHSIERKKIDLMKNELISVVSHEIRSPLTSILCSLDLVNSGETGDIPDQSKKMIDIAYRNSKNLLQMINDMLDIKKIESGKMEFDLQPVELVSLAKQSIEANKIYADQLGVEFVLQSDLKKVEVMADRDRMMQVITNLLSNAAGFSSDKDKVVISVSNEGGRARVGVTDHGPGIPQDFRERVFHKFEQASLPGTRRDRGTGLGLSIAKSIIERMGGQIGFETELDVGTTFYVDLPEHKSLVLERVRV